jgi:uncharacterized protein (DUF1330 family)
MRSAICLEVGIAVGAVVQTALDRSPEYQERAKRRQTAAPNRCLMVEGC